MSHFTRVATKINDLDALARACEALGWQYDRGSVEAPVQVNGYHGNKLSAPFGIRVPGSNYGIAVVPATAPEDAGCYEMNADWWGLSYDSATRRTQGEIVTEIGRAYSLAKVTLACEAAGYTFEGEPQFNEDGSIEVVAVQWGG